MDRNDTNLTTEITYVDTYDTIAAVALLEEGGRTGEAKVGRGILQGDETCSQTRGTAGEVLDVVREYLDVCLAREAGDHHFLATLQALCCRNVDGQTARSTE